MKRKRGKKGKPKKPPVVGPKDADPDVVNLSEEDNSGLDDNDKCEINSGMDIETPSSTGTDQPEKPASVTSGGLVDKTAGRLVYNRVKVKIKTSKTLESQVTSSDAHTHSDTDKSSQHMGLDKQIVVSDRMEDSANSLPENNVGVPVNQSKKAGSIKIKSRGFSSSSLSPCNNAGLVQVERTHQKEPELPRRDSQHNKQELDASLEVIKKIMKMDAAEPFNVPVNPVALGIPDYFDVIDTPMDFGTICSNLENGVKYMNSEDVFKDVRYIWENCYKYNSKGDYILELMKRVKKNFSKYWTAAGLYSEHQQTSGVESINAKDVTPSSHEKMPVKGGQLKHKSQKRHGVKKHKDDCQCAICIMMRRRQDREESAHAVDDQIESGDGLVQEVNLEGTSQVESPCGEDTSSMDNSLDQDTDAELEDKGEEVKLEDTKELYGHLQGKQEEENENEAPFQAKGEGVISEHSQLGGRSGEKKHYDTQMVESGDDTQNDANNEGKAMQREEETAAVEHQKPKELPDKTEKAKMYENLRGRYENPVLLELCGTLFAENPKCIWNGPHSLVQHQGSARTSSIHAAVATFMK